MLDFIVMQMNKVNREKGYCLLFCYGWEIIACIEKRRLRIKFADYLYLFLFVQINVNALILLVPSNQILILSMVWWNFRLTFSPRIWTSKLSKLHDCVSISDTCIIQVENRTSVAHLPAATSVAVLHYKAKKSWLHPYEIVITTDLQCHGARHCLVVLSPSPPQLML